MSNGSNISNLQTFIFFKYLNSSIFVEFQIYWIVQNYSSSRRTLAIWIKNTFESGTKIRCKFEATWLPAKHKISIISLTFVLGKGNLTRKRVNLNETQHLKCDVLLRCSRKGVFRHLVFRSLCALSQNSCASFFTESLRA